MNQIISSLLLIAGVILAGLTYYANKNKHVAGAQAFSYLVAAMMVHTLAYAFEIQSETLNQMLFFVRIEYLAAAFYPVLIVNFIHKQSKEKHISKKLLVLLLAILNLAVYMMVATNDHHHLYYTHTFVDYSNGFPVMGFVKGPIYYFQVILDYASFIYSIATLLSRLKGAMGASKRRLILQIIGFCIPLVSSTYYFFDIGFSYIDLSPFSFLCLSLFVFGGIQRYDILFLSEITHEMVMDAIDESVIVVDHDGFIISLNMSAKSSEFPIKSLAVGRQIDEISVLVDIINGPESQHMQIGEHFYHIRVLEIAKRHGLILVFNDESETVLVKQQLMHLASIDSLTQLSNRRHLITCFENISVPGVVMMLDIDHFKAINDTYGHVQGDQLLVIISELMVNHFEGAICARYGGEEFAAIFENRTLQDVNILCQAFQTTLATHPNAFGVTVSIGLADYVLDQVEETFNRADIALYLAKANGRNRIELTN